MLPADVSVRTCRGFRSSLTFPLSERERKRGRKQNKHRQNRRHESVITMPLREDAYAEDVEAMYRDKIHKQTPKYAPVVMRADVSAFLFYVFFFLEFASSLLSFFPYLPPHDAQHAPRRSLQTAGRGVHGRANDQAFGEAGGGVGWPAASG